jgi:hypothetical protein
MYLNILNTKLYGGIYEVVRTSRPTGNTSRVTLLQQRINSTPLYHVGLYVEERGFSKIFEHGPIQYDRFRDLDGIIVPLPHVQHTIRQLEDFEHTLPKEYIVGVRDCRHHVLDLLTFLYES